MPRLSSDFFSKPGLVIGKYGDSFGQDTQVLTETDIRRNSVGVLKIRT